MVVAVQSLSHVQLFATPKGEVGIEDFWSIEYILYDPIIIDACHFTFVQIHRIFKREPCVYWILCDYAVTKYVHPL